MSMGVVENAKVVDTKFNYYLSCVVSENCWEWKFFCINIFEVLEKLDINQDTGLGFPYTYFNFDHYMSIVDNWEEIVLMDYFTRYL